MLSLIESFKVLEKKKIQVAKYQIVNSKKDLIAIDFPYYIKASSPTIVHKTEKQAIIKCKNLDQAIKNYELLKSKFPNSQILIQQALDGVELILGLKKDPVFNKLLMIGLGGIYTETLNKVEFRALPLTKKELQKMIQELNLTNLFLRKKLAINKFIDLAEKVSELQVSELDLNPVILNQEQATIVDARIEV